MSLKIADNAYIYVTHIISNDSGSLLYKSLEGFPVVVCTAAVQRTLEPYCDSCKERVTANLLIGRMRLWGGEGEKLRKLKRGGGGAALCAVPYTVCCCRPNVCGCVYMFSCVCTFLTQMGKKSGTLPRCPGIK